MPQTPRAILIAGPTASGKSALALAVAGATRGTIVNADSMQVYAGLDVISSAPPPSDRAAVPHRLYGHVDPARAYSVGDWLGDVRMLMAADTEGPLIVVGGTGLYFHALTHGIVEVPDIPPEVRHAARRRAAEMTAPQLHDELARRDPRMATRLRPSDPQRIVRALEVLEATGRSLAHWQDLPVQPLLNPDETVRMVLATDRAELRERIELRFVQMMEQGALQEVAALRDRGLNPDLPAMKALGVAPLLRHLAGELSRADAVAAAVRDSRRYAKRQDTWARNRLPDWPRVTPDEALARVERYR